MNNCFIKIAAFAMTIIMLLSQNTFKAFSTITSKASTIYGEEQTEEVYYSNENTAGCCDFSCEKGYDSINDLMPQIDSSFFSYVDKATFESVGHVERLKELEDLNTYVFANNDGTRSIYYMYENVKYIDENGDIVEKDISLKNIGNSYTTVRNDVELRIPKRAETGVDVAFHDNRIRLIPQDLSVSTNTSKKNNSVIYDKAFGSNTKLKYTPVLSGVKEDIILEKYIPNASFGFILETAGLTLYNDENGYFLAKDEFSVPAFFLGDIIVYDSIGKTDFGMLSVETLVEGQKYLITVSANESFLADSTTKYPVTIDPSITVKESASGDSIIDAPIFKGYPGKNFGNYVFNRVGTPDSNYGIGRTVVKLKGLIEQVDYKAVSSDQIKSVLFYVKEGSGGTAQFINLYPLAGNPNWTESSITWNNAGTILTSLNCGANLTCNNWTAFNITELVRGWKTGKYPEGSGFIMMNSNESRDKCFISSDYATASNRPYVVMTFTSAVTLDCTKIQIQENTTKKLNVTTKPLGMNVTWTSTNNSIATVSSTGVVTGKRAGMATIIARATDSEGITRSATCTVYVKIENGIYYFKNNYSGLFLQVRNGGIADGTLVEQNNKLAESENEIKRLRQMWKVSYLGDGKYSIRPMNKLDAGLDYRNSKVSVFGTGDNDTASSIRTSEQWIVVWNTGGYELRNCGSSLALLQIEGDSKTAGTAVNVKQNTGLSSLWNMQKISNAPAGVYLFDSKNGEILSYGTNNRTFMCYTTGGSVEKLGITAVFYSPNSIGQTMTWSMEDNTVATIGSNTGVITGKKSGATRVIAKRSYCGKTLNASFDLLIVGNDQYDLGVRIAEIQGKQYYDFTVPLNNLFKKNVNECKTHRCKSWDEYNSIPDDQHGIVYYEGVLDSMLWFYKQVRNEARWDIKRKKRWEEALSCIPFLENSGKFLFRGKLQDAEAIGNIMYGYTGRAMGFSDITLFWGGGVAKTGGLTNPGLSTPPNYGDDENDHNNIVLGYEMFAEDYPDYPGIGYYGIPLSGWMAEVAEVILGMK